MVCGFLFVGGLCGDVVCFGVFVLLVFDCGVIGACVVFACKDV